MITMPSSVDRVARHTAERVNERIRRSTLRRIQSLAGCPPKRIEQRLIELDHEWDIERLLSAVTSGLALGGLLLAFLAGSLWWLSITTASSAFALLHAVKGWFPALNLLRSRGIRTPQEIDEERYALKALRGDFTAVKDEPSEAFSAVRHD